MRSLVFNKWVYAALAFTGLLASSQAFAFGTAGIPVECNNCLTERRALKAFEDQTESINKTIVNTTKLQTDMLEALIEYLIQTTEINAGLRETAIGDTQAALREEVVYGEASLPAGSCSVYASTGARVQGKASEASIRNDLTFSTYRHNRQSRDLPDGEPRDQYSQRKVIEELDPDREEGDELMVGKEIMDGSPIDPADPEKLSFLKRLQNLLANPFPVETPSEVEVERIKVNGTPYEQSQLAASIALQRRMEVPQYILDALMERDIQRINPADLDFLNEARVGRVFSPSARISPNELDEMLSTYRVTSKEWLEDVATAEDTISLARDQSMMQAEILNSLYEMRKLMVMQLRMQAMDSSRDISQAGLMGR